MPDVPLHDLTDPAFYDFFTDEHVRFSDTDLVGHVNNVSHVALIETGRLAYATTLAERADLGLMSIMFARLEIDFRADLFYPERVRVGARVLAIGRSSFRIGVAVFRGDQCISESVNVMVHMGPARHPSAMGSGRSSPQRSRHRRRRDDADQPTSPWIAPPIGCHKRLMSSLRRVTIPTAAYSVRLRVRLDNVPGTLGRLAIAVGAAGGNIIALEGFEAKASYLDEDVVVNCRDAEQMETVHQALQGLDGCEVLEFEDRTFAFHEAGKIEISSTMPLRDMHDLSMAYTPGVARVCTAIAEDPGMAFTHTIKKNSVAVVSDGTAVLGLGDIGPLAAMPVMEGKAQLFKNFGGVDAYPICLDVPTGDVDAIVEAVERIAPGFGGINLEDIAAPHCFEVERRLRDSLDIPVFHDDQHGTAVVVLAALENSLKIVGKSMEDLRVAILGVGASGTAIAKIMVAAGVTEIIGVDRRGILHHGRDGLNDAKQWFVDHTNPAGEQGSISDAIKGADVFVGVSGPGLVSVADIASMATDPIVFALANPTPEVLPSEVGHLAAVMATGRSDYPNQINNVLCFPGIFRGALDAHAHSITEGMKLAAARAIAACVPEEALSADLVIPSALDTRVALEVGRAVAAAAVADGVARIRG